MKAIFINIAYKFLTTSRFFPTTKKTNESYKILTTSLLRNSSLLGIKDVDLCQKVDLYINEIN
nr:hypothetical protein [uncultured bacterium]